MTATIPHPRHSGKLMNAPRHSQLWKEVLRYRCDFCRNVRVPIPLTAVWLFVWLLGFRQDYCPHCFQVRVRPCGWLKMLLMPFRIIAWVIRSR